MEEQLFPLEALQPAYDEAVWLYVYRDFSGDDRDRRDERIALRFGFSSYPQHKLVHPETLEIVGDTGRSVDGFLAAMAHTRVTVSGTTDAAGVLAGAEERARKLEDHATVAAAERSLADDDVVVRLRAVQILAAEKPRAIVARAESLLVIPNDPLRYAVCQALATAGDVSAARALSALVSAPGATLNPNVLRMHATAALARCGDAAAIDVLAPLADRTQFRNALTRSVVTTLVAIAQRDKKQKTRVRRLLVGTLPDAAPDEEGSKRIVLVLAKHVHAALETLTGRKVAFPGDAYDESAVAALRAAWARAR